MEEYINDIQKSLQEDDEHQKCISNREINTELKADDKLKISKKKSPS